MSLVNILRAAGVLHRPRRHLLRSNERRCLPEPVPETRHGSGAGFGAAATEADRQGKVEVASSQVEMVSEWVATIESMFRNADQVCMLRYEDIVHYPSRELVKLGEWLNVDPELFPTGGFKGTSVGRFKDALTPMEVGEIENVAKLSMQKAGYI